MSKRILCILEAKDREQGAGRATAKASDHVNWKPSWPSLWSSGSSGRKPTQTAIGERIQERVEDSNVRIPKRIGVPELGG